MNINVGCAALTWRIETHVAVGKLEGRLGTVVDGRAVLGLDRQHAPHIGRQVLLGQANFLTSVRHLGFDLVFWLFFV